MDLNLRDQTVSRVCFDAAFTILTSDDCELRVETEAAIQTPDGDLARFDPESPSAAAVHLVRLTGDAITVAHVESAGNLVVVFNSGARLTVAPHAEYEAWGLVGRNGSRVTCMPGGELALWSGL